MGNIRIRDLALAGALLTIALGKAESFTIDALNYVLSDENPSEVFVGMAPDAETLPSTLVIPSAVDNDSQTYTVVGISKNGFAECQDLISVELPSTITTIEDKAFYNCTALTSVNLPEGVQHIGEEAFRRCRSLEGGLTIPESVTFLGNEAFRECSSLSSVKIYARLQTLELSFAYCTNLESLEILGDIKFIGYYPQCSNLKTLYISSYVKYIDAQGLYDCYLLKNIIISEDNPEYCAENSIIFSKNKRILECWPSAKGPVQIPEGITYIGDYAFAENEKITSVHFPPTIETLGTFCFYDCTSLKSLIFTGEKPPHLYYNWAGRYPGEKAWDTLPLSIYVPESAYEVYEEKFSSYYPYIKVYPMKSSGIAEAGSDSLEETTYEVFSLDGRQVLKAASRDELRGLERGIYIVNGKKMAL